MKIGLQLHQENGIEAVLDEAKAADDEGFSTVWLSDHLANPFGADTPEGPFEAFTLMTAIAAVTTQVRLAWAMLNLSFRPPAVLAKMITTLDHISKGRVICSVGSGWYEPEYRAYDIPLIDDHDARVAYGREVVQLLNQLWTHPAPEKVNFEGSFLHIKDLAFNPAPYRMPHPPIWIGGDSAATLASVKELADGWVMLTSGTKDRLAAVTAEEDWPTRPMDLVRNVQIHVGSTRDEAIAEAARAFGDGIPSYDNFDQYLEREAVGTPDECLARLKEIESWGITEIRVTRADPAQRRGIAALILPNL